MRGACLLIVPFAVAGCVSNSSTPPALLPSVGPRLSEEETPNTREGTLVVFAEREPESVFEYPAPDTYHGVTVWRLNPTAVELVERFDASRFHMVRLTLPEGNFVVETFASPVGSVLIPVTVKAYRETTIDLAGRLKSEFKDLPDDALVKLPDGRVIGFRGPNLGEE